MKIVATTLVALGILAVPAAYAQARDYHHSHHGGPVVVVRPSHHWHHDYRPHHYAGYGWRDHGPSHHRWYSHHGYYPHHGYRAHYSYR